MGLARTQFPGVLWAQAQTQGAAKITKEKSDNAASVADVAIADDYKQMMLDNLNEHSKGYEEIYKLHIPNSVETALIFDPVLPGMKFETERKPLRISEAPSIFSLRIPQTLRSMLFAYARVFRAESCRQRHCPAPRSR